MTSSNFPSSIPTRATASLDLEPGDAPGLAAALRSHRQQRSPAHRLTPAAPLQMQVTNLDYNEYLGRIAIGRVFNGTLNHGDDVAVMQARWQASDHTITKLYTFQGLETR